MRVSRMLGSVQSFMPTVLNGREHLFYTPEETSSHSIGVGHAIQELDPVSGSLLRPPFCWFESGELGVVSYTIDGLNTSCHHIVLTLHLGSVHLHDQLFDV